MGLLEWIIWKKYVGFYHVYAVINAMRPEWNGHHLTDNICKCIFMNENVSILSQISQKFISYIWDVFMGSEYNLGYNLVSAVLNLYDYT